jgi:hypothetical protein
MQVLTAFPLFMEQPLVAPLIALVGAVGTKAGYGGWAGGVLLSLISLYFAASATDAANRNLSSTSGVMKTKPSCIAPSPLAAGSQT